MHRSRKLRALRSGSAATVKAEAVGTEAVGTKPHVAGHGRDHEQALAASGPGKRTLCDALSAVSTIRAHRPQRAGDHP